MMLHCYFPRLAYSTRPETLAISRILEYKMNITQSKVLTLSDIQTRILILNEGKTVPTLNVFKLFW